MKPTKILATVLLTACLTLGACGAPESDTSKTESALLAAVHANGNLWASGSINDDAAPRYVCNNPQIQAYWYMYVNINQSPNGVVTPGVLPLNWGTKITGDNTYLASDPSRALATLDCPTTATMTWSSSYNVLYNTNTLNCTIKGHVPGGPTVTQTGVVVAPTGLQYVPGVDAPGVGGYGYWSVAYSVSNSTPQPNGTGYCGPATRTFGT